MKVSVNNSATKMFKIGLARWIEMSSFSADKFIRL